MLRKILITAVLVAAGAAAASYLGLILIGDYLTPTDPLAKSDAIVVLSGGSDRTEWGIKLYADGWAPKIIFVGAALYPTSISNAAAMKKVALAAGVPGSAILLEEKSTNTLENAEFSAPILAKISAKKIILVTSPYHQRRAYDDFHKVLDDRLAIINSPSGYSQWSASSWWEKPASAHVTTSEILKLLWTQLTGEYD